MPKINEIAAAIHRDMCEDERNGYSWEERWGNPATPKVLMLGGTQYAYNLGDYDCSSSVIKAWRLALVGTAYEGALDGAMSTHSIRSVFLASGLFDEWDTSSTSSCIGDLYLNDQNHVAMCQSPSNPDTLSEFSGNEFGGAYGGQRGDQTGWESHIRTFYDYPWNRTMHYNGKADGTVGDSAVPAPTPPSVDTSQIRYAAWVGGQWLDDMYGHQDSGFSDDDYAGILGRPMGYLAIDGVERYRVKSEASGWLPWVYKFDKGDLEDGCAGDGSPILAVEIADPRVRFACHDIRSGWHGDMVGQIDTEGTADTWGGDGAPIDGFRAEWA